ncbi:winged helix-turn-helix domain-containing protein [Piscinibacter terrae]|nr:winged helix-turn-helix domain-containing protein [Albitalea terrae]
MSTGIEVLDFATVDALVTDLQVQEFAAILVEDDANRVESWLAALQAETDRPVALIAIGAGGASGMSRALLHGADDYFVVGDAAEQLVHRSIARVSAKIQRPRKQVWRLGPYKLDISRSCLISPTAEVRLSPRELALAHLLIENDGKVVPLDQLCERLCASTGDAARRAVKQHAHTLRKKCQLVAGPALEQLRVEPVYGKGYRLTL